MVVQKGCQCLRVQGVPADTRAQEEKFLYASVCPELQQEHPISHSMVGMQVES